MKEQQAASQRPDVFRATSIHDYLKGYCDWKKANVPTFSVRALAKKLDFKSHSLLAMIVRGERLPRPETLKVLADYFELTEREYDYLLNLLFFQKAKNSKEKLRLGMLLTKQRPPDDDLVIEVDGLAIFERWYHIAVLEMTLLKNFHPEPEWIAQQLGTTVTAPMVVDAIERLLRSGLLERAPDGTLQKSNFVTRSRARITTSAMRSYQKQMLQRAAVAIESQQVHERLFMNTMVPFDSRETDAAKDMIADFIEKFQTRFGQPKGDCVYFLGTQFFFVTRPQHSPTPKAKEAQ